MKGKKEEKETKGQGSFPCPYCDEAPKKSAAGLSAHIRLKHPELYAQKGESKEKPIQSASANVTAATAEPMREPPKQPTMADEIEAKVIEENAPIKPEQELTEPEVTKEEASPETSLDIGALLSESGISGEMISAVLAKAPVVAGLSVAIKTLEQKLVDVVDVIAAMNEEMKPLLALYQQYKPMIEKQATGQAPETEQPELSPEEQQHLEAQKLAEMAGQPGENGGRQASIERYIGYGLKAMELAKPAQQGAAASPVDEVRKNMTESMQLVASVMTAANKATVDQLKGVVGLIKFVKDEVGSTGSEKALTHVAEKVAEVAE